MQTDTKERAPNDTVEIKKGLVGVYADETKISKVDPNNNSLMYHGYRVQDLAEVCSFEEVAYLIWYSDLPTQAALEKFCAKERELRGISKTLQKVIESFPQKRPPHGQSAHRL